MPHTPCEVCKQPTNMREGRCTNRLCAECHRRFCSPGGVDGPGHGIDLAKARATLDAERKA